MKAHCNECGGDREHEVIKEHRDSGSHDIAEDFSIDWNTHSWMLRCAGCSSLAFRVDSSNSEAYDERGRPEVTTKYYPPRIFRQKPRWMSPLSGCPAVLLEILEEAYVCMQNECRRGAAMLIRAALEKIMIDRVGDCGTFGKNLSEFQTQGYLAARQRKIIEPVLEAGHASIHRSFLPTNQDLLLLFDVTETLIEFVYVHNKGAKALKKRVPRRRHRKKPNKAPEPTTTTVTSPAAQEPRQP